MDIKDNSIAAACRYFRNKLAGYYDKPEIESMLRIVFFEYFGLNSTDLILKGNNKISESEIIRLIYLIKELKKKKPLAYILGHWQFYGLDFIVNEHTLIPRPETEELVQVILQNNKLKNPKILDIGTGTGCIAIALKKNLPQATIYATDIDEKTIETAIQNAKMNELSVNFICTDIVANISDKDFDIIVSNPPYISDKEKDMLDKSVIDYEPHTALFSTDNPLYFYKAISKAAQKLLQKGGKLYFEINPIFVEEIKVILAENNFTHIQAQKDINQKWRIIRAEK